MKIIFYIFTIFPLKPAFFMWDALFKVLPLNILRLMPPFRVTKTNLSIAFPGLAKHELDLLAKESYKETLKSFYETLFTWSRSSKKIICEAKRINNRFLFNSQEKESGLIIFALHNSCLLYTSPSPRDRQKSRMPSSA